MNRNIDNAFDHYERRICQAMADIPHYDPAAPEGRGKIVEAIKDCLGIKTAWTPDIKTRVVQTRNYTAFSVETVAFTSWDNVVGSADLYLPSNAGAAPPLVLLCCGHGEGGMRCEGYQAAARLLAKQGAAALVPDNIGQGSRTFMGHSNAIVPFACGTSLQGLIALEALGWVGWAKRSGRFDTARLAAIGNSGGGLLTTLLAALSPDLAALCSSGYPSSFEFIARKEKNHCCCNIIPGVVGRVEIWHLLGCFAPKPLFIFQGANDNMFPEDVFFATARKVSQVYGRLCAAGQFAYQSAPGTHPWDEPRRHAMGAFLAAKLGLEPVAALAGEECALLPPMPEEPPGNALTTDTLARQLTGMNPRDGLALRNVFTSIWDGQPMAIPRGDASKILAQFAAFLGARPNPHTGLEL